MVSLNCYSVGDRPVHQHASHPLHTRSPINLWTMGVAEREYEIEATPLWTMFRRDGSPDRHDQHQRLIGNTTKIGEQMAWQSRLLTGSLTNHLLWRLKPLRHKQNLLPPIRLRPRQWTGLVSADCNHPQDSFVSL